MTDPSVPARPGRYVSGERIYLRALVPADAHGPYAAWMNDPEVLQFLESRFAPHSPERLEEWVRRHQGDGAFRLFAICLHDDDRHVGNLKLGPIDWVHRFAEVAYIIGDRECWGRGYATEAVRAAVDYAFGELNLRRVFAACYANNEGSRKVLERAGLVHEGTRRQHYFYRGTYVDELVFGRLRDE